MWDGIERRKGPDWLTKFINALNLMAWLLFIAALLLFHLGRPEMKTILTEIHQIEVRENWIESFKLYLRFSLFFNLAVSLLTLVINRLRMKRKSDHQRYNLVFLMIIASAFLTVIFI